jgi:signal peptidase II
LSPTSVRETPAPADAPRRRRTDREPRLGWRPVLAVALVVALLDWSTKYLIASRIAVDQLVVVWQGRVAFWHVHNPALVLGLFGDLPLGARKVIAGLLGLTALVVLVEVVSRSHRLLPRRRPWAWLFGGLVLGGMMGNLGERALHWWVTDFLSFRWGEIWLPPGNVADLAILCSIPLAGLVIAFELEARRLRISRAGQPGRSSDPPAASGARERRSAVE